MKPRNFELTS